MVKQDQSTWRKGQSCISNPNQNAHREAARANFNFEFADPEWMSSARSTNLGARTARTSGNKTVVSRVSRASKAPAGFGNKKNVVRKGGLTTDALKQLNDQQDMQGDLGEPEKLTGDLASVFENVRRHMNSPLESHREICALLECVREVILSEGEETETAYFATLMTLLEQQKDSQEENTLSAIAYLLSLVVTRVPTDVLKQKFPEACTILISAYSSNSSGSNSLLKSIAEILQFLLIAQDSEGWNQQHTMKPYNLLLSLTSEPRPKIRRKAQEGIVKILAHPPFPRLVHPACGYTAKILARRISENCKEDLAVTMHDLSLLTRIIAFVPEKNLNLVIDALFKVLTSGNNISASSCLETFNGLFNCSENQAQLSADHCLKTLLALLDHQPNTNDVNLYTLWVRVLTDGFVYLYRLSEDKALGKVSLLFRILVDAFKLDSQLTHTCAYRAFEKLLVSCSTGILNNDDVDTASFVSIFEELLGYAHSSTWTKSFQVWSLLVSNFGLGSFNYLRNGLFNAAQLYKIEGFKSKEALHELLGNAIATFGARNFFSILPLEFSENGELSRAWILPVCAKYLRRSELKYFNDELLPLASQIGDQYKTIEHDKAHATLAAYYRRLHRQIWTLFPGFCTLPTDCDTEFKKMAKTIGTTLQNNTSLRFIICQSLDTLIRRFYDIAYSEEPSECTNEEKAQKEKAIASLNAVKVFSKNFMAVLFNLYLSERNHVLLTTVKAFCLIGSEQDINQFGSQMLTKFLNAATTADSDNYKQHGYLDLLLALYPRLDSERKTLYYRTVTPLLKHEETTLQKLAYGALAEVFQLELNSKDNGATSIVHSEVFGELCQQLHSDEIYNSLQSGSKKTRLRLLITIVPHISQEQLSMIYPILSEVILSTKEVNETTRKLGFELLIAIGKRFIIAGSNQESFEGPQGPTPATLSEFFKMVLAGLGGTGSHMLSATITALSRIFYDFFTHLQYDDINEIINTILMTLQAGSQEIVKASLGFIKVAMVAMEVNAFSQYVEQLVSIMMNWEGPKKYHFRMKIRVLLERLIRKYGYEYIENMIPETDRKVIINIRKRRERDNRKKNGKKESFDDLMDEDSEDEAKHNDDNDDDQYSKKSRTWIKESEGETVDFLDSSIVKHVVSSNPNKKKKENETWEKFNKDGKMLIEDSDDSDDDDDANNSDIDIEEPFKVGKRMFDDFEARPGFGKSQSLKRSKGASKKSNKKSKEDGPALEPFGYVPFNRNEMNKRNRNVQGSFDIRSLGKTKAGKDQSKARRIKSKTRK